MINRRFHKIICSPMLWLTVALVMALALGIPHTASADPPENSQELQLGETVNAVIDTPGQTLYFSFTPEETERYLFSAESNISLNSHFIDGYSSFNFGGTIEKELTAGTTYYFSIEYWFASETGTIPVTIDLAPILNWEVDENDILTISGRGKMEDYYYHDRPWSDTIKKVIIEEGITSIGNCAFRDCSSLTSIEIPNSVTRIGEEVFCGCNSLTSIEIPAGVTGSIGNYAFSHCNSLSSIEIPAGVTGIGDYAFYECSNLTSIEISVGVTSIGDYAFYECSSLIGIEIPDNVTSIGKFAFYQCSSLTSLEIPDSVTYIGDFGFNSCSSLTSLEISDGITSIGKGVFANCYSLTCITFPENVTCIGNEAFSSCHGLISIDIPESVINICEGAFSNCFNLTNIRFSEGVINIGDYAFSGCEKLEKICFLGMNIEIGDIFVAGLPTVYCYRNSTVQAWAEDQELPIVFLNGKDPASLLTLSLPQTMKVSISRQTPIPASIFNISPINSISWISTNENILTVDEKGVITPINSGTAQVTLTIDGKSASSVITVCPLATELLMPDDVLYAVMSGDNFYTIQTKPQNALVDLDCIFTDQSYGYVFLRYSDESEKIYYILPNRIGTTSLIIRDRYSGLTKTVPIHITRSKAQSIAFEKKEISIQVGQTVQLNTIITLDNGYQIRNYNAYFSKESGDSATIDQMSGKVIGIRPGKTTVQCWTYDGNDNNLAAYCTVTVTKGTEIIIPKNLKEIKFEAFAGTDAINYIIQPGASTIAIRNRAFADLACDAVSVHIPSSVTIIEDKAFEGCDSVIIFGTPGSEAETYANNHDNCSFVEE